MTRFNQMMMAGAISVLALAGCTSTPAPTASTQPEASPSPAMESPQAASSQSAPSKTGLLEVVTNTRAAVEAEDFATAKTEFGKFEGVWSQIEDGIKEASAESYDAIEENMDAVDQALTTAQPNKEEALAALQGLAQAINTVP